MLKNFLIVGGSSGLGLELAKIYNELGHAVFITDRKDPKIGNIKFFRLDITDNAEDVIRQIDEVVSKLEKVNTLIWAAGFYQEGYIDKLKDKEILKMINIGLAAPALLVKRLKNNHGKPLKVMLITSSSQYTPREFEPVYTAVKAGLGMFGESLALDQELGKVFVAAPSGMKTCFWRGADKDVSEYLDPKWVAEKIVELSGGPFKYRFVKILRSPQRVEIAETRQ